MKSRGAKKPRIVASAPGSLRAWNAEFLEAQRARNYSEATIHIRTYQIEVFATWAEARDVRRPQEVTRPILERYLRHLYHRRKEDGRPLSATAQLSAIGAVRAYFRWLNKQNVLLGNPAADLDLPRMERRLPKGVLTAEEAEKILAMPDISTATGLRDRAMLEVLYSTGMRRKELAGLEVFDIDTERGTALIRKGKGNKDRMVPVGERALAWVERYVHEARSELAVASAEKAWFLTPLGVPAHEIALIATIALRFVPILVEELERVMRAQASRGGEIGNLSWRRPVEIATAITPLVVPLFVNAFRRAEEMAIAMEARCYMGGSGRTRFLQLQARPVDYAATLFMFALVAGIWFYAEPLLLLIVAAIQAAI